MIKNRRIDYYMKLDDFLTEQDKKYIVEMVDIDELRFSLGAWITKNWVYGRPYEEVDHLTRLFYPKEDLMFVPFSTDVLSKKILEGYQNYLRNQV